MAQMSGTREARVPLPHIRPQCCRGVSAAERIHVERIRREKIWRAIMRTPWKILTPALIAASVPWLAGSAGAAPLSPSLALKSADVAAVETVQWRRGHRGRWIGPAAGFAAGVAIGSAFAPRYYNYGYYGD